MHNLKLSTKLSLLIVVTAAIVIIVVGWLVFSVVSSNITDIENAANVNSVNGYASAVSFYLNEARSIIEITAQEEAVTGFPGTASSASPDKLSSEAHLSIHKIAAYILESSGAFEYIMLLDAAGFVNIIEPHELQDNLTRQDLAFTDWYKKLVSSGQTVISDLNISPATQRPTVVVAASIRNSTGQIIGVWAGGLKLDQLSQIGLIASQPVGQRPYGYITDSRGLIIAHQLNPKYVIEQTDFSSQPTIQGALSGRQGTLRFVSTIDGIEKLGAYMPLPGTNWAAAYVVPVQVAFAEMNKLAGYLIGLAILMLLLMGLGAFQIIRQTTKPLSELTEATAKIGTGDLSQRIQVKSRDEIGQLGTEFNRMAASLSEKAAELRSYATHLERKVHERTEALTRSNEDLQRKTEELKRSNAELERFAYVASHDLQEPLRMVASYTQLLEKRYKDKLDTDANDFISYAVDGANRMQQLINDLLSFSRVGTWGNPFVATNCEDVFRSAIANLDAAIRESAAVITHDALPTVMGDEGQLVQLFQNLLGNAIKFHSQETPQIHVSARVDGVNWVFSVQDNGIGIDPQYFDRIFIIFQRLHHRNFPGTGIGLAISKRIAERHGGQIWIDSRPDKGSTFYFTIPIKGGKI